MYLALLLFALAGILKAYRDSTAFHPWAAILSQRWPKYFGTERWRWPYINGDIRQGRRYHPIVQALITPVMDGWHMLDSLQLLLYASVLATAYGVWYLPPIAWMLHQLLFSAIWQTPLTHNRK